MPLSLRKSAAIGLAAIALAVWAQAAQATELVTNGSFEEYTGSAPKGNFPTVLPTGWSGGSGLTFIDAPGTATSSTGGLAVYPGFPTTSPDGGNFVEADGDPNYSGAFYQSISGLAVGQSYTLTFYQAAGQQNGFTGPTTEQWDVTFGEQTQDSTMYSLAQGATGAWEEQTMTFIASATTQVLSFLAYGTPGGAPPISFLDGVSLEATPVPEPTSLALVGVGLLGLTAIRLRRRSKDTTAV